ncbi:MAG TPA: PAS domain S-box protein, partial [Polyangiales bacterium]|nr:PAS domain S-box protein [Polyangiales bacterium]
QFDGPDRITSISAVSPRNESPGATIHRASCPSYFRALASERAIAANDVYADHRTNELREYFIAHGIGSLLDAPVRVFGRCVAVVCHEHVGAARQWLPEEESFAGAIGDFVALALEVQAHRKAESVARAAHQRYKHLVESLPCVVYSFAPTEPRVEYVSPQISELTGVSVESMHQPDGLERYIALVHPDDRAWLAARIQHGIGPGVPTSVEYRLRLADGSERWVADTCGFLRALDGRPLLLQGTLVDITELAKARREGEEHKRRFRTLLEEAALVAVLLDADGKVTFVNDFFLRLTDRAREQVVGRDWFDLALPAHERAAARRAFQYSLELGVIAPHRESAITTKAGDERLMVWSDTLLRDSQGQLNGTASLGSDVTERTKLERQAWRSQKAESLGRLAAGIAHDFNNVLAVVTASVQLMRHEDGLPPRALETLSLVDEATSRAAELTRSLLLYAREESGEARTFAIDPLLSDLRQLLEAAAGSSVSVRVALAADGVSVRMDPTHLQQIILNLVVNARDAMPEGGTVRVSTEEAFICERDGLDLEPGRYVVLRVSDTGPGVPDALIERVFDPFFTTKAATGGTGLGLATCAGIARRAGGRVIVRNDADGGACFATYLPVASLL